MFDGLSKKDIYEVLRDAIAMSIFFAMIYICIYLIK